MLPKVETPVFSFTVPSTNENIKYRPFLVKEEKILSLAYNDPDPNSKMVAIKEIIKNCTFNNADIEKWTAFDIELFYLKLRSKSKGSIINLIITCPNEVEGHVCGHDNNISIDFDKYEVDWKNNKPRNIQFEGTQVGIKLNYPKMEDIVLSEKVYNEKDVEGAYSLIYRLVDCILDGDKVIDKEDISEKEFIDWLEYLRPEHLRQIEEFLENIPQVSIKFSYTCSKCGFKDEVTLEGLPSFLE